MPSFSTRSRQRLATCDIKIQQVFKEVIKHYDCTILEGHREEMEQNEAFRTGKSTLRWPDSKHNQKPSVAVDVAPYPVVWEDLDRFRVFGGFVLGVASALDISLRWGGDWDGDWDFKDQRFHDLPHFELRLTVTADLAV